MIGNLVGMCVHDIAYASSHSVCAENALCPALGGTGAGAHKTMAEDITT